MADYFDLGSYSRPVTTSSADAQTWFDRGLAWTYGYVECLRRLGKHDEAAIMQPRLDAAMAHSDVEITASCACRLAHECCE